MLVPLCDVYLRMPDNDLCYSRLKHCTVRINVLREIRAMRFWLTFTFSGQLSQV